MNTTREIAYTIVFPSVSATLGYSTMTTRQALTQNNSIQFNRNKYTKGRLRSFWAALVTVILMKVVSKVGGGSINTFSCIRRSMTGCPFTLSNPSPLSKGKAQLGSTTQSTQSETYNLFNLNTR